MGLLATPSFAKTKYKWDWYWGIGAGASNVDPEGEARGWSTDDSSDFGYKLMIGADISDKWGMDIAYHDLGSAGLGNKDPEIDRLYPNAGIDYRVFSTVFNYAPWFEEGDDYHFYGKIGVSSIKNKESEVIRDPSDMASPPFDEETSVQIVFGAGFNWTVSDNMFIRTEFEHFDRDAYFFSVQFGSYF